MSDLVPIQIHEGVAILRMDREGSLNAMTTGLARAIVGALVEADADDRVRGIVLTGAGRRAFCAGVDLAEAQRQEAATIEAWFGTICGVYRAVLDTNKPLIAAINGVAAGAGSRWRWSRTCGWRYRMRAWASPRSRPGSRRSWAPTG